MSFQSQKADSESQGFLTSPDSKINMADSCMKNGDSYDKSISSRQSTNISVRVVSAFDWLHTKKAVIADSNANVN